MLSFESLEYAQTELPQNVPVIPVMPQPTISNRFDLLWGFIY